MPTPDSNALQTKLGHHFKDQSLLARALTHQSCGADSNERLEFLGDSILNYVVGEMLFTRFPTMSEGNMSRIRSGMVCHASLLKVAERIGLEPNLRVVQFAGLQEKKKESILSDAVEALFAAVQLDAGHAQAKIVILSHMTDLLERDEVVLTKDSKTKLQEHLQGKSIALPVYQLAKQNDDDPDRRFEIDCIIASLNIVGKGTGPNRKAAEKAAAKMALEACRR